MNFLKFSKFQRQISQISKTEFSSLGELSLYVMKPCCKVLQYFFSVLFKASEKIHSLSIEDCQWCDVEILPPTVAEKTWLASAEDPSCSFIGPKVTLPSFLTPSYHTNFTYMSSVQQDMPSELLETPETEATRRESDISGFSSDYVTSVATKTQL